MTPERRKAEELIIKTFDAIDPTGANTKFWKEKFASMDDSEFKKFTERTLPFRLQTAPFKYEPTTKNVIDAYKVLDIPLLEDVYQPYLYEENGRAVTCKKALIAYVNLVPMKQMLAKKNSWALDNSMRESKTGRLTSHDKAGLVSDREVECFLLFDQYKCLDLFAHEMADDMEAKSQMLTQINSTGMYSQEEVTRENQNQISKNTVGAYLLGSCLYTNLINKDYMTPWTLSQKERKVERET